MKLYNTASRSVEEFVPLSGANSTDKKVGMYACGLTVYDYTHLGHLRKYTMDDILVRTLRHAGYNVNFVQNITDVGHLTSDADEGEDKLEKGAKKYGKTVWDVARFFEDYFWKSMDLMGNLRPDISCRATEHVKEQLEMVKELEKKGYAYVIENDGVYFDTSKFAEYGKMARLDLENQEEGHRVAKSEGKRNPTDFALWKFEREGENRAMVWESPWHKRSFPGWHIECSAMAIKYLGEQFEIHTGGIDHIPVHHTNEIAQAESFSDKKPFVKYWVHHNFLRIDGEKMSKSLGNFYTIDDLIKKGYEPRALRLLFLTTHYQSEMNFTWESMDGAQKAYAKLLKNIVKLRGEVLQKMENDTEFITDTIDALSEISVSYKNNFYQKLEDNLGTPEAVAILWSVVGDKELATTEKLVLLFEFDQILGLNLSNAENILESMDKSSELEELPKEVTELLKQRKLARESGNWAESDRLRDIIQNMGYLVKDTKDGQEVEEV